MFLAAGYLVEVVTGGSWEEAIRSRIFEPLGMTHSNFSVEDSRKAADFALPYEEKDDEVKVMPFRVITNMGPAGSINSTTDDMTKWVLLQLGGGKSGERRLINTATLTDMHTSHMAIAVPPEKAEMPEISYGMGWFVQPYRGHNRIHHGGNIDGFSAMVSFLPQDQIGMVVLSNLNGTPVPELLMRHAMDRLLGLPRIDWAGEALGKRGKAKEAEAEAKDIVFKRKPDARMSDPAYLKQFLGEYELAGQVVTVALKGNVLTLTVPGQPQYELVPDRLNEFNLKNLSIISVKFTVDEKEGVTEAVFNQPEGVFTAKRKK